MAVCLLSVFVHGLFFVGIVQLNKFDMFKPLPRVIQVDLVSFVPGPASGQVASDSDPGSDSDSPTESVEVPPGTVKVPLASTTKKMPARTIPKPVVVLKPEISLKAKPANLKELMAAQKKKETPPPKKLPKSKPKPKPKPKVDPEEALKKAREKLAKKIEKQNEKQISEALNRLQAAVETKGNEPLDKDNADIGPGGAGAGTGVGKQGYSPLDLYKLALQSAIEQNWVFNDMLARMNQHLEVRVMIKILKSGEIRDIAYETKSGNRYLDESAKKAIKKANPLPKLPAGMTSFDLVVGFTPKGLK